MASSSSSSSSPSSSFKRARISSREEYYDVFLSFRGEDTRNTFTSHLYDSLVRNNIKTFIDNEALQRGDKISRALEEAIERSKLAIVVFSKDYASSSWCLEELVHILKCREENDQIVVPVFYHVHPYDVRRQIGSFAAGFAKHEERFEGDIGKVKAWRDALSEAANLSGWDSQVIRPESELVKKMVEDISKKLNNNPLNNELKQLDSKLKKARLLLDDAENRQLGDPGVKEWLDSLKHVNFQADDFAEEIENEKSGWKSFSAGTVKGEIGLILTELDGLLDRVSALGLKHCDGTARGEGSSSTANQAPLLAKHRVFGRDGDKDVILELLLSDSAFGRQQIGVVPIVGMGGIGKTTLAHLVYNDTRVKPEFQRRAWVTVSTKFDICKILKTILEKISPGAVGTGELYQLQEKMEEALSGKKFLIVLDDVWDESYNNWNLLKSNFEWGALGSRVVVTTRSGKVGDMVKTGPIHRLREVSREDCWSIFIDHAFRGDSSSYPQLQEIGGKIVKKCDGLPLAVMAMGGLLYSTRDPREWEHVLNNHVWDIDENNQGHGVLPSLWLSYRYLPSSVKQCFAYCSVFPQDYEFNKEQMVLLWMAEGFLPSEKTEKRSMEELGEQTFDILVSRSLFQRSSIDESMFVMHDLIHDLAAFVSKDFCVSVAAEDVELKHVTVQTRHLALDDMELDSKLLTGFSEAKHLRSFLRHRHSSLSKIKHLRRFLRPQERRRRSTVVFFPGGPWDNDSRDDKFVKLLITNHRRLRALSICISDLISASLYNLKHLRYLNLSGSDFKEVPSSVCTLFNLQTLILSYCTTLTQLPTDITKLIKLRHLDISGSELIKHMPPDMGNLKELRTLSHFIVGDTYIVSACSNIKEMQELQHLSGKLRISGLENAAKFQDVGKDILRHKANLKELVLKWDDTSISRREDKDILDALQPHTNLETLSIEGYKALSFLTRLDLQNLTTLKWLSITKCACDSAALSKLFTQVLLPNSLAFLHLWSLGGLKSINGSAFQQAKSLKTLKIDGCNELESLPEEELPRSLSTLEIIHCRLLERKYHKIKGDESYQRISHIPNIDIRGPTTNQLDLEERRIK